MHGTDPNYPDKYILNLDCSCAGGCSVLVLERWVWDDDEQDDFYADIYQVPRKSNLKWRLRNAWRSLMGQPTYDPGMAIDKPRAIELRDWLNTQLEGE